MYSSLGVLATLLLLLLVRFTYNLVRNIQAARKVGVPIVFVPVHHASLFWLLFSVANRNCIKRLLPTWLWNRVSLTIAGWEFHEKKRPFQQFAVHDEYDQNMSFILVGLFQFEFWTADPKCVQVIVARYRDFEVPPSMGAVLGRFGPNVLTTNGDQWARHRKAVANVINERISKTVFEESLQHSHSILTQILQTTPDKTGSTDTPYLFDMLTRITLNVLIGTGLSDKVPWKNEEEDKPEPGFKMTYTESLGTVVDNALGAGLLPIKILTRWPTWLRGHNLMRKIGCSMIEVHKRSQSLLSQERERIANGVESTSTRADLLSNLVRASKDGSASGLSLSEEEMISNLFIFTAGGYKTTAAALAYAVVLLARLPQWQEWLLEEVDSLISADNTEPIEYATTFPKAIRLLAFVMETMRLYGGSSRLIRKTSASPQPMQTSTGTIHLPARTGVLVNTVVLHRLPIWRNINRQSDPDFVKPDPNILDEDTFRPSRWINPPGSTHIHYHPPKGSFLAWSGGPRICPGQKMAQIEFTVVMLMLLKRHRIEAVPMKGECPKDVEERLSAKLEDADSTGVMVMNGIYNPKAGGGLSVRLSQRR